MTKTMTKKERTRKTRLGAMVARQVTDMLKIEAERLQIERQLSQLDFRKKLAIETVQQDPNCFVYRSG